MFDLIPQNINYQAVLWALAKVLITLLVARLLVSLSTRSLKRLESKLIERRKASPRPGSGQRLSTIFGLVSQATVLVIWVTASILALDEIGFDIRPLLAGAGVVGLAVGFGAQNLVRDVITGFFMILENQISLGDFVEINGKAGIVEAINFRTTVLRALDGTVHIFPNGEVKAVANGTHGWSAAVVEVGVAYNEEPDRVIEILEQVGHSMSGEEPWSNTVTDPVEVFGLDQFGDSALVFKVRLRTLPLEQWSVAREYRKRVKVAFDEAGVTIPFPQRTLHYASLPESFKEELKRELLTVNS
jgi:moderate conductance mechanosensitive channel